MLLRSSTLRLGAGLALLALPGAAHAAGLGIPDLGANALGQGGAYFARPADTTAIYFNPAGLAGLEGWHAELNLRLVDHRVSFQRTDANGKNEAGFLPVENTGSPSLTPMGVVTRRFTAWGKPLTVALGGHPFNGYTGYRYPDPTVVRQQVREEAGPVPSESTIDEETSLRTPQRYASISADSLIFVPVVAAGLRLSDKIDVGLAIQAPVASLDQRQSIYANTQPGENTGFDAVFSIKATSAPTISGLLGVSVQLPADLVAGLAVQLPTTFHCSGTITADLGESVKSLAKLEGDQADIDLTFPWIARAGVRLVKKSFEVELAGTYEAWSMQKEITLTPKNVFINMGGSRTQLEKIVIPKGLQDAGSVRLGGEYKLGALSDALAFLKVRAGALYETSAVPLNKQSLDTPSWERLSLNVGLGAELGRFDLALAFAHLSSPTRQVRASEIMQTTAIKTVEPAVVGNGDYNASANMASLMIGARF